MRLFSAAVPPPDVAAHLADALTAVTGEVDPVPPESWHITLGYYGEEDAGPRIPWFRSRADGLVAPVVALSDMGSFGSTLWMGVSTVDSAFAALGAAMRWTERREWHPHLTIGHGVAQLAYASPQWTISEIVLLGAVKRYEYTVVDRIGLPAAPSGNSPG